MNYEQMLSLMFEGYSPDDVLQSLVEELTKVGGELPLHYRELFRSPDRLGIRGDTGTAISREGRAHRVDRTGRKMDPSNFPDSDWKRADRNRRIQQRRASELAAALPQHVKVGQAHQQAKHEADVRKRDEHEADVRAYGFK